MDKQKENKEWKPKGKNIVVPDLKRFDREELENLSLFELRHHARMFGVRSYSVKPKTQLIEEMLEIIKGK